MHFNHATSETKEKIFSHDEEHYIFQEMQTMPEEKTLE